MKTLDFLTHVFVNFCMYLVIIDVTRIVVPSNGTWHVVLIGAEAGLRDVAKSVELRLYWKKTVDNYNRYQYNNIIKRCRTLAGHGVTNSHSTSFFFSFAKVHNNAVKITWRKPVRAVFQR